MVQFSIAPEYKLNLDVFVLYLRPLQTPFLLSLGILCFRIGLLSLITMANRDRTSITKPELRCYLYIEVPLQVGTLFPSCSLNAILVPGRLKVEFSLLELEMLTFCHLAMQLGMQVLDCCIAELVDYGMTCIKLS